MHEVSRPSAFVAGLPWRFMPRAVALYGFAVPSPSRLCPVFAFATWNDLNLARQPRPLAC
jgi:hypothetical protein